MKFLLLLASSAMVLAQAPTPKTPLEAPPTPAPSPATANPTPGSVPEPAVEPPKPPPSPRQLIDGLSDEEIQAILQALQKSYLDPSVASEANIRRAAIQGFLSRLGHSVSVLPGTESSNSSHSFPFLSEILDARIGYVRPGALDAAALSQFDAALKSFSEKGIHALILDLRALASMDDFETAAEFARRLSPSGKLLFTLEKPSARQERMFTSNREPNFHGQLLVLIDSRTSGPAEALAAALRSATGALVLGSDTAGAAFEFETIPVGGKARLRIAIAQVLIPQTGALFPGGVKPDIAVGLAPEIQDRIFQESSTKGISQFVFEAERRHMNEAALVANTNPEIDASALKSRTPSLPRDTILQRAVDLVTAIQFYEKKPAGK